MICTTPGCSNQADSDNHLCPGCLFAGATENIGTTVPSRRAGDIPMSEKYPKYYKRVPDGVTELDVYGVCQMFPVVDDTGCINHARKKLLVPGTRTGGKSFYDDIKEARDTLNRWLELNASSAPKK